MTSRDDLPGRIADRSAAYEVLLRTLLDLVGVASPSPGEPGWYHRARRDVGKAVTRPAMAASETHPVPEEWFEPLLRAAVHEPDPASPGSSSNLLSPRTAAVVCNELRRYVLPGLPLDPQLYPDTMHHLVTQAVRIARTSPDDHLRHRVEIQLALRS